jgi:hypothetical protein
MVASCSAVIGSWGVTVGGAAGKVGSVGFAGGAAVGAALTECAAVGTTVGDSVLDGDPHVATVQSRAAVRSRLRCFMAPLFELHENG